MGLALVSSERVLISGLRTLHPWLLHGCEFMQSKPFSIAIAVLLVTGGYLAGRAQSQTASSAKPALPAEQVTGVGGIFIKVQDPKKLAAWYRDNLGIPTTGSMAKFLWSEKGQPEKAGYTVWSLFPTNTTYFGNSRSAVMINYRVANLDRMIEQLRSKGIAVEKTENYDYGRFTWVTDPEGNRLELWEQKGK